MEIRFTMQLPRDALSVPVVRRVFTGSMATLGVSPDCLTDIEVALTEACTNVLDHAADGDEYEVVAGVDERRCVIDVVDTGHGFDPERLGHGEAEPSAEAGRGIQMIRALVDRVQFRPRTDKGTIVRLEKRLAFQPDSPLQRLADRGVDTIAFDLRAVASALAERGEALEAADGRG